MRALERGSPSLRRAPRNHFHQNHKQTAKVCSCCSEEGPTAAWQTNFRTRGQPAPGQVRDPGKRSAWPFHQGRAVNNGDAFRPSFPLEFLVFCFSPHLPSKCNIFSVLNSFFFFFLPFFVKSDI